MATLLQLRDYVRAALNEYKYRGISDSEINRTINDGVINSTALMQFYEETQTLTLTTNTVAFTGHKVKNADLLIYHEGSLIETRTLLCIRPTTMGFAAFLDDHPTYWFQFGNLVVVDPSPSTDPDYTYELRVIVATYPDGNDAIGLLTSSGEDITTAGGDSILLGGSHPYLHYDTDTTDDLSKMFVETVLDFALAYSSLKFRNPQMFRLGYNNYIANGIDTKSVYVDTPPDTKAVRKIPKNIKQV